MQFTSLVLERRRGPLIRTVHHPRDVCSAYTFRIGKTHVFSRVHHEQARAPARERSQREPCLRTLGNFIARSFSLSQPYTTEISVTALHTTRGVCRRRRAHAYVEFQLSGLSNYARLINFPWRGLIVGVSRERIISDFSRLFFSRYHNGFQFSSPGRRAAGLVCLSSLFRECGFESFLVGMTVDFC